MTKVAFVSTITPEICGSAIYADNFKMYVEKLAPEFEVTLIGRPFDGHSVIERCQFADIVHINHSWGLFFPHIFNAGHINRLKSMGKKVVCTFQESTENNRSELTSAFDRVIVHQNTTDGFTKIYHGCSIGPLNQDKSLYDFIGTAGFPVPFKNYPLASEVAQAAGKKLYAILPAGSYGDAWQHKKHIEEACPGSIVDTSWPTHEKMLDILSKCALTLWPYRHEGIGIGGSPRIGIGAQRPVVISNLVRHSDLMQEEFKKEFYVIEDAYPSMKTVLPVVQQCLQDIENGCERIPVETLKAMSWDASAQKYIDVYRELL